MGQLALEHGNSPIFYIVRDDIFQLVTNTLKDFSNIHVVKTSETNRIEDLLFKGDEPGIFISYATNPERTRKFKALGVLVHEVAFYGDENNFLTQRREFLVRALFGRTLSLEDWKKIIINLGQNTKMYLSDIDSTTTRETLKKIPGFENGYIALITNGSQETKQLIPSLTEIITASLEDFCKANGIGVLIIDTSFSDTLGPHAAILQQRGISTFTLTAKKDIPFEEIATLLLGAKGLLSPDTFLMHILNAAIPSLPKLIFTTDANVPYWAIPGGNVIDANTLIAMQAIIEGNPFAIQESRFFAASFFHPFYLTTDEYKDMHPFFQLMQQKFLENVSESIRRFIASLASGQGL